MGDAQLVEPLYSGDARKEVVLEVVGFVVRIR
jgi:hypothetical protein